MHLHQARSRLISCYLELFRGTQSEDEMLMYFRFQRIAQTTFVPEHSPASRRRIIVRVRTRMSKTSSS
jgi:hypothetical protein